MANNKIKKILILLGLGGIAVSSYLTYIKLTGAIYVCGTGGCATVQTSKYSEMMGIPVAILGLIYYTAFLGLVLIDKRLFVKYWVVFGVLFSTYLTIIEIFVIKAICGWCVSSFAIILVAALITFNKSLAAESNNDLSSS